jgi:hypothetical protein
MSWAKSRMTRCIVDAAAAVFKVSACRRRSGFSYRLTSGDLACIRHIAL